MFARLGRHSPEILFCFVAAVTMSPLIPWAPGFAPWGEWMDWLLAVYMVIAGVFVVVGFVKESWGWRRMGWSMTGAGSLAMGGTLLWLRGPDSYTAILDLLTCVMAVWFLWSSSDKRQVDFDA